MKPTCIYLTVMLYLFPFYVKSCDTRTSPLPLVALWTDVCFWKDLIVLTHDVLTDLQAFALFWITFSSQSETT